MNPRFPISPVTSLGFQEEDDRSHVTFAYLLLQLGFSEVDECFPFVDHIVD